MMSMGELLTALNAIEGGPQFVAWAWDAIPQADAWGTVSPDGSRENWAGGRLDDQAITGTVDLFTRSKGDDLMNAVQAVLGASGMPWGPVDILYDSAARAIHYAWDIETIAGIDL